LDEATSGKSKVSAGLACGALWTISKGIKIGDIVTVPMALAVIMLVKFLQNAFFNLVA
jgi:restriction system protein